MAMTGRHLSLAYRDLQHVPVEIVDDFYDRVEEIDLSYNKFSELRSLSPFTALTTLVLDHNQLTSHVKFPNLPRLQVLWLNHNNVSNLPIFIESISKTFPRLQILSMMNNPAAPSYFNGGSYDKYEDYRWYVISHFGELKTLDDTPISAEERQTAERAYGRVYLSSRRRASRSQSSAAKQVSKSS